MILIYYQFLSFLTQANLLCFYIHFKCFDFKLKFLYDMNFHLNTEQIDLEYGHCNQFQLFFQN